jgi:hypothetical protein
MTKDEMVQLFKSAPMGSRYERLLWAARKIARLNGDTKRCLSNAVARPD